MKDGYVDFNKIKNMNIEPCTTEQQTNYLNQVKNNICDYIDWMVRRHGPLFYEAHYDARVPHVNEEEIGGFVVLGDLVLQYKLTPMTHEQFAQQPGYEGHALTLERIKNRTHELSENLPGR